MERNFEKATATHDGASERCNISSRRLNERSECNLRIEWQHNRYLKDSI
ncbi:hypothetical protein [Prevotella bivia]|nr:hypothetical protein [Prevotella bivia]WIL17951.1 hypothetical protein QP022_01345 [Prevotella bivia]